MSSVRSICSVLSLSACLCAAGLTTNAQSLEIIKVEQQGKVMTIYYDLVDSDPANTSNIYLSEEFAIVRKVPLVVVAVPLVAIPLVIMGLPQAGPDEPQSLPDPLKPD